MASGDREVEKERARREHRTKLEGESRKDLQSLAKQHCIPANLKSKEIIDQILHLEYDNDGGDNDVTQDRTSLRTLLFCWREIMSSRPSHHASLVCRVVEDS